MKGNVMPIQHHHRFPQQVRNARHFQQAQHPVKNYNGKVRGVMFDPIFSDLTANQLDHVLDRDFDHLCDKLNVNMVSLENAAYLNSWSNWALGQIAKTLKNDHERMVFYYWKCTLIFNNGNPKDGVRKCFHDQTPKSEGLRQVTALSRRVRKARQIRETTDDETRYAAALEIEISSNVERRKVTKGKAPTGQKTRTDLKLLRKRWRSFFNKYEAQHKVA